LTLPNRTYAEHPTTTGEDEMTMQRTDSHHRGRSRELLDIPGVARCIASSVLVAVAQLVLDDVSGLSADLRCRDAEIGRELTNEVASLLDALVVETGRWEKDDRRAVSVDHAPDLGQIRK
jgi:hypothetical protein